MSKLIIPSEQLLISTANTHKFKDFNNPKTCVYCGSKFYHGRSDSKSCGLCYIESKCILCGKLTKRKFRDMSGKMRKEVISMIKDNRLNEYSSYCGYTCSSKSRMSPGICSSCGKYSDKRSVSFLCEDCQKIAADLGRNTNTSPGYCLVCGQYFEKRMINGYCQNCHTENINKIAKEKSGPGKCIRCSTYSEERTIMGLCLSCHSKDTIKNNNKRTGPGYCTVCKEYSNNRNIFGKCPKCIKDMLDGKNKNLFLLVYAHLVTNTLTKIEI